MNNGINWRGAKMRQKSQETKNLYNKGRELIEKAIASAKTEDGRLRLEEVQIYDCGYAEPGYRDDGYYVVATGNWNSIDRYDQYTFKFITDAGPRDLAKALDDLGISIEWNDEWIACCECSKLVRTQPNSYSWQCSYEETENGALCMNCIVPEEYLEALENNDKKANTIRKINPAHHGYVKLNTDSYEHGLHVGQDASPKVIAEALRKQGLERFIFNIDSVSQFDISFSVYIHKSEQQKLNKKQFDECNKDGPSVSEEMKRRLKAAQIKKISQEDFVKGSK